MSEITVRKEERFTDGDRFLKRLEAFVNTDTPSGNAVALNILSASIEAELTEAGIAVTRHKRSGGDILTAKIGNGKRQLLYLGHMDTVFPDKHTMAHPFVNDGEKLRGPGVLDMKAGVCMIIEILLYFKDRIPEDFSIVACFNADEEIGSSESCDLISELAGKSELCFCMESSYPGFCTVARKGITAFTLKAEGVSAHSGTNYTDGHSAIEALCRTVAMIYDLRDDRGNITVNIGSITGGSGKRNIIADYAEAKGEIRYYDNATRDETLAKMKELTVVSPVYGTKIEFTISGSRPAMPQSEASKRLFLLVKHCADECGLSLDGMLRGGGSDGAFAAEAGIPVVDGMSAEGDNAHTDNEYVLLSTLIQRLNMNIKSVEKILKGEFK